ncbi:NBR1-Ig-like domain-containing protein [Hydrogenophaga sp. ZJX-1]|uniref:NBR1-Ig-like domain-containing protein n=1 Tax=Hydrogenophaga sp. ZJX-1 TaxID=3404778 RepID=UPI003B28D92A
MSPSARAGRAGLGDRRVTVPDHTVFLPGERFTRTWVLQNPGRVPWNAPAWRRPTANLMSLRNALGQLQPLLDSHLDSLGRSVMVPITRPGQLVALSVEFSALLENCSVASIWRLEDAQGRPCFGPRCFLQAVVSVVGC